MPREERVVSVWSAVHDNGWVTKAVEIPDGRFAAWAAPDDRATTPAYIEDGPENAKNAAEFALRETSGHSTCSARCTGWQLEQHRMFFTSDDGVGSR